MKEKVTNRYLSDADRKALSTFLTNNRKTICFWSLEWEIKRLEMALRILKSHSIEAPNSLLESIEHLKDLQTKTNTPEPEEIELDLLLQIGRCDAAEIEEEIAEKFKQFKDLAVDLFFYNHARNVYKK